MGVTVHYMSEAVDDGTQICQEKVWTKGFPLQEIYDLLFGVVEPMAVTRAMEKLLPCLLRHESDAGLPGGSRHQRDRIHT